MRLFGQFAMERAALGIARDEFDAESAIERLAGEHPADSDTWFDAIEAADDGGGRPAEFAACASGVGDEGRRVAFALTPRDA